MFALIHKNEKKWTINKLGMMKMKLFLDLKVDMDKIFQNWTRLSNTGRNGRELRSIIPKLTFFERGTTKAFRKDLIGRVLNSFMFLAHIRKVCRKKSVGMNIPTYFQRQAWSEK